VTVTVLLVIVAALIAELYVIVQVAHHIGVLWTLALLVLFSASGPWLVRRTGLSVWRRAQTRLNEGEVPGREIIDGVLLLAAGLLLTVPGFLSGIAGVLLLLPPVRAVVRSLGSRWLARRAVIRVWTDRRAPDGSQGPVIATSSRPVERRSRPDGRALERGPDDAGDHGAQAPYPGRPDAPEPPHPQDRPKRSTGS
jgi:UPF0716 protein FxsA